MQNALCIFNVNWFYICGNNIWNFIPTLLLVNEALLKIMINKTSITNFLARKLNNYDWLKKLNEKELRANVEPSVGNTDGWWNHQRSCYLLLECLKRFMLFIDMGGGKALPNDEPVLTPHGWTAINQLKIGDFVIGSNGNKIKVTGVFPQGKKDIFNVIFSDRTSARCCEDHLWAVTTPTRKWLGKNYNIKSLKELKGNLRDSNGWRRWFIPVVKPITFTQQTPLPLNPYVLGAWLGDGSRGNPSICSGDEEIAKRVLSFLPRTILMIKTKNSIGSSMYNYVRVRGSAQENSFTAGLRMLNLFGKYSYERFIPRKYLYSSIDDRILLLQGLMDTDGFVSKDGKCYYDTSSKKLADDFAFLVRSLGGTATVSDHKPNQHKGHYNIYLVLPVSIQPCFLSRKKKRLSGSTRRKHEPTKAIEKIEKIGKSRCTCISVDAEDGLFVTKDFIVTHNTFICLSLIKNQKLTGKKPQAIVFVPYITSVETWITETAKHTPELICVPLIGTTENNLLKIQDAEGDLFVICYQSAVAMLAEPVKQIGKRKKKWNIDPKKVKKVFGRFNMLVMDEIHRCKSIGSLTYRMCRAISSTCEYSVGLTGTPFGRDLLDLWAQFYLIDFGATLGPTLGFYREVFFKQKLNYWGGFEYTFKQKLFDTLQKTVRNNSIRYAIDEFSDMPPKEYITKKIKTHSGIKSYAEKAMAVIKGIQIQKSTGNYRAMESEYLKLRQLSSGFMTLQGDDSAKLHVKFDENPKLDMLQELIEDMPHGCKMIVFHHFVYSNELISERLKQMKVGHARIYGGTRDPIAQLRQFKTVDTCSVLVINSRSGSSSLNLQHANYCVFFEQPDSAIDRQQAERRCWRPGQDKRVFVYDLIMGETADWAMHKANKAGESLLKNLLDGKIEL